MQIFLEVGIIPFLICHVGPDERDLEHGEDIDKGSSICLLKPRVQRNLWELTIAFEPSQGCSLGSQHLASKKAKKLVKMGN